jgi:hypothetical protein
VENEAKSVIKTVTKSTIIKDEEISPNNVKLFLFSNDELFGNEQYLDIQYEYFKNSSNRCMTKYNDYNYPLEYATRNISDVTVDNVKKSLDEVFIEEEYATVESSIDMEEDKTGEKSTRITPYEQTLNIYVVFGFCV